jgi:hypothetical protein
MTGKLPSHEIQNSSKTSESKGRVNNCCLIMQRGKESDQKSDQSIKFKDKIVNLSLHKNWPSLYYSKLSLNRSHAKILNNYELNYEILMR